MSMSQESSDEILVDQLARGANQIEAGDAAGVSDRTVRRRLEDPQFVSRVRARRSAILDEVNAFIVSSARAAAETIDELRLGAESESVRLNAALAVIRTSRSIVEVDALGERLSGVEQKLVELEAQLREEDT